VENIHGLKDLLFNNCYDVEPIEIDSAEYVQNLLNTLIKT